MDKKIVWAEENKVKELQPQINKIIYVLIEEFGFGSIAVSDRSMLGDFGLEQKQVDLISEKLGIKVCNEDFIVDIARKLYN